VAAATALSISIPASADDIDVYSAVVASQVKPNIMFVLDYSGSMARDVNDQEVVDGAAESKIEILKSAVNAVLQDNAGKINAGLGSLYRNEASGVKWPASDLAADANTIDPNIPAGTKTVADIISSQLSSIGPDNATATVNGLAEAAAYFRGDPVRHIGWPDQPDHHKPDQWDAVTGQYTGGAVTSAIPSAYTPTNAYEYDTLEENRKSYGWCQDSLVDGGYMGCADKVTFNCGTVEEHLSTWDATPSFEGGPGWDAGSELVEGYTHCQYYHPDAWTTPNYVSPIEGECQANFIVLISDGMPTALNSNETLDTVLKAAGVPAGKSSSCEDLSTTIFNGTDYPVTEGNCAPEVVEYLATSDVNPDIADSKVKTFTVGFSLEGPGKEYLKLLASKGEGQFYEASKPAELNDALSDVIDSILSGSPSFTQPSIDLDPATFAHDDRTYFSLFAPSSKSSWSGNLKGYFLDNTGLLDVYGNTATVLDPENGLVFANTAQSFWSSTADGNDISTGGVSEGISNFTATPFNRNLFTFINGPGSAPDYLSSANTDVTDIITDPRGPVALDWLANAPIGDPLHTKPVSVNYGVDNKVVFVMTNQGILHAFDASKPTAPSATPDLTGGNELFAFMPKELLKNIPQLYQPSRDTGHIYGLDGTITRWHNDLNGDGYVDAGTETIKLIIGMRRGGNSYYSIDVTDPNNPELDWQISGDDADFPNLAQTWSRASLVRVIDAGVEKDMLMFGGGYDAAVVDGTTAPTFASGNAIYFVDPADGSERATVTNVDMNYSIPSDLTIIDTDRDGIVDRTYFGDLGGQVWRLDFDDIQNITVSKVADVNEFAGDHQPLFYAPSVSINRKDGERFLALSFGSGDRTQPMLNSSDNWLYMIRDMHIDLGAPDAATFSTVYASNLYDASNNDIGSGNDSVKAAAESALDTASGWKIALGTGEKSLSKITTYQGTLYATTFDPNPTLTANGNADPCSISTVGRLYMLNLLDGQPVELNSNGTTSIRKVDGRPPAQELKEKFTIPPSATIAYLPAPTMMIGKEPVGEIENEVKTVFWHAK